jgi:hypothetical protein
MKIPLNDFHRKWIAQTCLAMAERPAATRQDLIDQTLRLREWDFGPAPETMHVSFDAVVERAYTHTASGSVDEGPLSIARTIVEPARSAAKDHTPIIRQEEERLLKEWLKDKSNEHLRIDDEAFQREWENCGELGRWEDNIWPTPDGQRFMKRTHGKFNRDWQEYLKLLEMRNLLFPSTPFRLEGFGDGPHGSFRAYVSQPAVYPVTRSASAEEVNLFMTALGFSRVRDCDYLHVELGILVEDMNRQNVLWGPGGNLMVINPNIYTRSQQKGWRLEVC